MLKLEVLFSSSFSLLLLLDDELKLHALHSILIGERWKMRKLLWITFFFCWACSNSQSNAMNSTECEDSNEVSVSPSSEKIVSKSGKSNNFKILFEFFFSPPQSKDLFPVNFSLYWPEKSFILFLNRQLNVIGLYKQSRSSISSTKTRWSDDERKKSAQQ